jgi:hypothetical protein
VYQLKHAQHTQWIVARTRQYLEAALSANAAMGGSALVTSASGSGHSATVSESVSGASSGDALSKRVNEFVERFVRNARSLRSMRFRSLAEEADAQTAAKENISCVRRVVCDFIFPYNFCFPHCYI